MLNTNNNKNGFDQSLNDTSLNKSSISTTQHELQDAIDNVTEMMGIESKILVKDTKRTAATTATTATTSSVNQVNKESSQQFISKDQLQSHSKQENFNENRISSKRYQEISESENKHQHPESFLKESQSHPSLQREEDKQNVTVSNIDIQDFDLHLDLTPPHSTQMIIVLFHDHF
jgi:hypothetical protein